MRSKFFLALLLTLVATTPASGQIQIVGRIIDDFTEMPLDQAEVTLMARDGSVLDRVETSETGTFEFDVRGGVRAVRIGARRLGYRSNTTPILYFDHRMFFQVEVRLDPDAILLAPLEVIAWSEVPENAMHEGYLRRLQNGLGTYITREQVEARNPVFVTDMLRELPGLTVTGSGSGLRPVVRVGRSVGQNCITQIFVDGFLMNGRMFSPDGGFAPADFRIDDLVSPHSIEGIEVYRGLATVPPEFLNPDAECGVIAIWTRRGGVPRRR